MKKSKAAAANVNTSRISVSKTTEIPVATAVNEPVWMVTAHEFTFALTEEKLLREKARSRKPIRANNETIRIAR